MTHLQTILKTLHMLMARIQDFMQLRNNSSIICNKLPLKRILFNNLYIKPKLFLCRKVTKLKIIKVNLFSRKTSQCERNMETLLYSFKPPLHFSPLDLIVHNFLILQTYSFHSPTCALLLHRFISSNLSTNQCKIFTSKSSISHFVSYKTFHTFLWPSQTLVFNFLKRTFLCHPIQLRRIDIAKNVALCKNVKHIIADNVIFV